MPSLILTSDDFGLSKIFNQRMIELLQSNFLSSISIMINQVTSDQQNQIAEIKKMYAKNNFSLGLHLEVSEADDEATYQSQWNMFEQLLSIPPDYIDVHKGHFQNATGSMENVPGITSTKTGFNFKSAITSAVAT